MSGEVIPVETEQRLTVKRWFKLLPYAFHEYFKTKLYVVRLWLAKYMALAGNENAIDTLCKALDVKDCIGANPVAVRVYAAEALGKIRSEKVSCILIDAIENEENLIVKEILLESLAQHRYPEAFDVFVKYLNFNKPPRRVCYMAHPLFVPGRKWTAYMEGQIAGSFPTRIMVGWGEGGSRYIRKSAAKGLGLLKDPRAVSFLIDRLKKDTSVYVRRECAYALARIGDPIALPHIAELLNDEAISLRRAAARVIPKLVEDPNEGLRLLRSRLEVENHKLVIKDLIKSIRLLQGDQNE